MGDNETCIREPYNITAEEQPSQTAIITKGVFLTIAVTTSFVFNVLCLVVLHRVRDRSLNHVTKIFMISFTLCDLFGIIFVFVPMTVSTFLNDWPFGSELCKLNGFAGTIFAFTSGIQLLALNLERYLAITYPLKWHNIYITPKKAKITVAMLWLSALAFSGLGYLLPGRYTVHSPHLALCTSNPCGHEPDISGTILSSTFAFLPVFLTLFLWLKMYLVARRHTHAIIAQAQSVNYNNSIPTPERRDRQLSHVSSDSTDSLFNARKTSSSSKPKTPVGKEMDRKFSARASLSSIFAQSGTLTNRKSSKSSTQAELSAISANRQAFFTFFIISIFMAVSSFPFLIVIFYDNVMREMLSYTFIAVAEFLVVSFGFLNVMIYYARNAAFRRTALKVFLGSSKAFYRNQPRTCKITSLSNGR